MIFPEAVKHCLHALEQAGFRAYAVGGCVRDHLLGLTPHDYDICTDALPEETSRVFENCRLVRSGEKHGTIGVVMGDQVYEITTFRTEGGYQDHRHPDWVKFVSNVEEDLSRRDFTVNAMAIHPVTGLCDPFGGARDLENKILRAVGDPDARFTEDALRILRGVRFAVRFALTPEEKTLQAMFRHAPKLKNIARERVFEELCKLLPLVDARQLKLYFPVLVQATPELQPMDGFLQHTPHHKYDVLTHTALVVQGVPKELTLRWAALLHDVGKPQSFTMDENGRGHFKGHAHVSARIAGEVLESLRAPTELKEEVDFLIRHHMTPLEPDRLLLKRRLSRYGEHRTRNLLALQQADFSGKGTGLPEEAEVFPRIRELLEQILTEKPCLSLKTLAVSGKDLMALGMQPGPRMGQTLNELLQLVVAEKLPNEKTVLLREAKAYLTETGNLL